MQTTTHPPRPHISPFTGFDRTMERWLGADMRLVYGMAASILTIVGMIVILALVPWSWLVGMILVVEMLLGGVVIVAFVGLLSEDEDDTPTAG